MPDFGSLDNLVVSVPEPGTGTLLLMGALALAIRRIRTRRKRRDSDSTRGQAGNTSVTLDVLPITPPAIPGASLVVTVTPYRSVQ